MLDSGLCVLSGCLLCGWSVLLESSRKQVELMLFVAPRALAVLVGRRYDARERWKEHAVFAVSAAVLLTVAQERPEKVRGVFGGLLLGVLKA